MDDRLLLDLNDFKVIRKLGNGACGDIYLIKKKSNQNLFAAKVSRVECKKIPDQKSFFREISSLSKAKYPAVLPLIGFNLTNFEGNHFPTIITEFMPKGSLSDIFNSNLNLPQSKRYIILLGIAEGMKYLHSIGITHRDLKPGNIVLDDNFYPYISDFGTSKLSNLDQEQISMESFVGTPLYMAPEIFSCDQYTYKVDVYSFSLVMYQLITGNLPKIAEKQNFREIAKAVTEGKRPDLTIIEDEKVKLFLSKCWSSNPSERPEFSQIVEELKTEKYFKLMNVNYNDVKGYIQLFDKQIIQNGTYYFTSLSNTLCVSVMSEEGLLFSSEEKFDGLNKSFNIFTNEDRTISLRSNLNGYFVMTNIRNKNELIARSSKIQSWEKFIIEMKSDSQFALKSVANSMYVSTDSNDEKILKANSDKFKLFTLNEVNLIKEGEYFIQSKLNNNIVSIENNLLKANKTCLIDSNEIFQIKHNLKNGTISLISVATKKYVTANLNDDDKCLFANASKPLLWEEFIFVPVAENEFGLKSLANEKYVMTDLNGSKLRAVTEKIAGTGEIFTFHQINTIKDGCYFIKSGSNGKIISAGNGSEEPLVSSKDSYEDTNEIFLLNHNTVDATISLKSLSNGRYVSVMLNQDKKLMPLAKNVDLCEKFILVPVNDSKVEFGLKSVANGKYVTADLNNKSELKAIKDTIAGSWEIYTFTEI